MPLRSGWIRVGSERAIGITLLALLTLAFIIGPDFTGYSAGQLAGAPLQQPSSHFLLGTDDLGRDVLTRVLDAGRTDMLIAVASTLFGYLLGTTVGIAFGTTSARVQQVYLRVLDGIQAFPFIIVVLMLAALGSNSRVIPFFPPGAAILIFAITLIGWAPYARLATAQTNVLKHRESVLAATMLGYSKARVILRHLMPSVAGVNLSFAATNAVAVIGVTASLSFLGAGIQQPTAELGAMMNEGLPVLATSWWVTVAPAGVVLLLGLGFTLLGDATNTRR